MEIYTVIPLAAVCWQGKFDIVALSVDEVSPPSASPPLPERSIVISESCHQSSSVQLSIPMPLNHALFLRGTKKCASGNLAWILLIEDLNYGIRLAFQISHPVPYSTDSQVKVVIVRMTDDNDVH